MVSCALNGQVMVLCTLNGRDLGREEGGADDERTLKGETCYDELPFKGQTGYGGLHLGPEEGGADDERLLEENSVV